MFDPKKYFLKVKTADQRKYEALRAYYLNEGFTQKDIAEQFGYTFYTFQSIVRDFTQQKLVFFPETKKGPKKPTTPDQVVEKIIALRKRNFSICDIYETLEEENLKVSISTINRLLGEDGFSKLPRRTSDERGLTKRNTLIPQKSYQLAYDTLLKERFNCQVSGVYLFIPYMLQLGLDELIRESLLPGTNQLSSLNSMYSIMVLKLIGQERLSQIDGYNFDRGFGFFAGLNVLPKPTTISTYSYNVDKKAVHSFMKSIVSRVDSLDRGYYSGKIINLDFHSIPHYGDDPPLDNNWVSNRGRSMKSALTLLAHDSESGMLNYVNADIKREDASNEILNFVKCWVDIKGVIKETLVFDSKLTNYRILSQMDPDIKFITLRRRRSDKMIENTFSIPDKDWKTIKLDIPKRKYNTFKVYEHEIELQRYELKLREIVIKDHGREKPTFVITNNRVIETKDILTYYAQRWRIENKISDLVKFFNLNALSSPVMIRIHFDVTTTMLADILYKMLTNDLERFEKGTPKTIFSKFINTPGEIVVDGDNITVKIRKKANTPILKSNEKFKETWKVPWFGDKRLSYKWVA